MRSRTPVVVIGGGIAGCSTLHHLTREGWSDVVLLERDEQRAHARPAPTESGDPR